MVEVMGVLIKANAALSALLSGCMLTAGGTGETQDVVAETQAHTESRRFAVPNSEPTGPAQVSNPSAQPVIDDGGVSEDAVVVAPHDAPSAISEAPPDSLPPEPVPEEAGVADAGPTLEPINGLRACPEASQCMSDGYCHDDGLARTPSGSCEAEREYCYVGPQPENTIGRCVRTDQDWVICAYVCEPSRN